MRCGGERGEEREGGGESVRVKSLVPSEVERERISRMNEEVVESEICEWPALQGMWEGYDWRRQQAG